jgi:hypothetical protein
MDSSDPEPADARQLIVEKALRVLSRRSQNVWMLIRAGIFVGIAVVTFLCIALIIGLVFTGAGVIVAAAFYFLAKWGGKAIWRLFESFNPFNTSHYQKKMRRHIIRLVWEHGITPQEITDWIETRRHRDEVLFRLKEVVKDDDGLLALSLVAHSKSP